jgi:hypothetical protein
MIAIAMSKEELPHAILKFISWIPEPIRQDVLASVFPYAARARIENGDDAIEKMREFLLKQRSKLDTASALLSTIAAFDYVLKRHIGNIRNLESTSTDTRSAMEAEDKLSPLSSQSIYIELVFEHWNNLRAHTITHQAVRNFEYTISDSDVRG